MKLKKYTCIILAMVWMTLPPPAFAQDVLHYYIIYDASGSVYNIDRNNNLQNSVLQLLDATRKGELPYNKAVSFSLIPFGESDKVKETLAYDPKTVKRLFQRDILQRTQRGKTQRYSNMIEALRMAAQQMAAAGNENGTGVFIFTDGFFTENDISDSTGLAQSKTVADSLLLSIEKSIGPGKIFYIQTSPKRPRFDFANNVPGNETKFNSTVNDSCRYNASYFWIASRCSVEDSIYQKPLSDFLYSANIKIITPNKLPLKNEQEVAITIQEVISAMAKTDSVKGAIKPLIINLKALLKQDTIRSADVRVIQNVVAQFLQNGNKVRLENLKIANWALSPHARSILSFLKKDSVINPGHLQDFRDTVFRYYGDQKKRWETASLSTPSLSSIALTESYLPAAPVVLTTEAKAAKGWENFEQNLINGTADYLVKRTKQEVVYSFIVHLRAMLKDEDAKGTQYLMSLFPTTWSCIENENDYPDVLKLRDAFRKDIINIPSAIVRDTTLVKGPGALSVWLFMRFYEKLLRSGDMEQAFKMLKEDIRNDFPWEQDTLYLKEGLTLSLNLISYLQENDIAAIYHSHNDDSIAYLSRMLYLLSLDSNSLSRNRIFSLKDINQIISGVYREYDIAKKQIYTLKALLDKPPRADFEGYRKYQRDLLMDILNRSASLLTSGLDIIESQNLAEARSRQSISSDSSKPGINYKEQAAKYRIIINDVQNGIDVWFNIQEGNYRQAMLNLSGAIGSFAGSTGQIRNILFLSGELANANNAEEVSNILSKYMLPVASYHTKRKSKWSLMLNAYLGFGFTGYQNNILKPAIHAPIGIELSKNFSWGLWHSNISFMASLFDVGNIVNYRLLSQDTTTAVSFERIFSPGVTLSVGLFNNTPIAFITGYQFNPKRYIVGLTVDLPLAGIWKKNATK